MLPARELVVGGHDSQPEAFANPLEDENDPAEQFVQTLAPDASEKVPAPHFTQPDMPAWS
jgi:hypothetical protein